MNANAPSPRQVADIHRARAVLEQATNDVTHLRALLRLLDREISATKLVIDITAREPLLRAIVRLEVDAARAHSTLVGLGDA